VEHLQHFGLAQDPFSNEPDLRFFFESASHRDAQRRVERGLRQHKGLTLLAGEGGMGKSLLARRILDSLEEEVFEAILLVMMAGAADATGILQRFVRQLGTEDPSADRATLLSQIYEQLAIIREDGRHAVLMIDDAQVMTPEVFAELGGLLNLEYEDRRMVSMLLIGSPVLDALVQRDASMAPRIDVRVQLHPLSSENAAAYVAKRLASVGASTDLVPVPALDALYKFGRGRPRLINTLADNALFEAYLAGRSRIEPGDVERAAMDLGVGPDPGTTYTQTVGGSSARPAALDPAPEPVPFSQTVHPTPAAPTPSGPRAHSASAARVGADVTLEEPFDLDPIEAAPAAQAGGSEPTDWSLDDLDLSDGVEVLDGDLFETGAGRGSGSEAGRSREKPAAAAQALASDPDELDGIFVELIEE
jgi:type II secretory pathway predicted ATPase ExeA